MIPKFRIWRKVTSNMVNVSALFWKTNEDRSYLYANWWYATDMSFVSSGDEINDDNILMQSTGLFDKNGVEIFEGDVVKYEDSWDDYGPEGIEGTIDGFNHAEIILTADGPKIGRVKIPESIIEYLLDYEHQKFSELVEGFEVIGNIYEKPELVEEMS